MPRIHPRLIGTSLYLYGSDEEAADGSNSGGSGVIIGVPSSLSGHVVYLYAVTNDHVIRCGSPVPRAMTKTGSVWWESKRQDAWTLHETADVAACWIGAQSSDPDGLLEWMPREWIATMEDLGPVATRPDHPWATGPIIAGEDTFSVGRHIGFDGVDTNKPVLRFGNLSSSELVAVEQDGSNPCIINRTQESLLVEARSLGGYSGAPVFAYRTGLYWDGGVPPVEMAILLGIGWGHLGHPSDLSRAYQVQMSSRDEPSPGRYSSGIMVVVPGWKITELLDLPELVAERDDYDRITRAAT